MTAAPTRTRTSRPKLDAIGAAAVDQAREALLDVAAPGQVGEHLRVEAGEDRLVTHVFECTMPGYRGWSWVVVMARAPRAKFSTVAETALLPGEDALLAPAWEPWSERLKPEDVGTDDLLPYRGYDERLEHGYEATGEEDEDRVALWELGLGRVRVLSPLGRAEAAQRWIEGEFGPREVSQRRRRGTVSASCSSCGFLAQLGGSLRGEFGVCTNEWSPADGRVVSLAFGCGAHSETGQDDGRPEIPRSRAIVVDELDVVYESVPEAESGSAAETAEAPAADAPAVEAAAAAPEAAASSDDASGQSAQSADDSQAAQPAQDAPAAESQAPADAAQPAAPDAAERASAPAEEG